MSAVIEQITGRYVHVELDGRTYRTYFEEAGQGPALVCLHTSGTDSRFYRHLLNDEEITSEFRVIAFDMPWHGRSLPGEPWWQNTYRLTRRFYVDFVAAFCDSLGLDQPFVLGCSMGGYVVLDIARDHPDRYRGLIGVQTREYTPFWGGVAALADHPEVNFHTCLSNVRAMCSPETSEERKREIVWIQMTNGPGVMAGDMYYASEDHDSRPYLSELDAKALNLFVISGDDDLSCLAQHSDGLASAVPGLEVTHLPGVGHFPPAENPDAFKAALLPILQQASVSALHGAAESRRGSPK
jgi:pimeloyl-ACP methyl ester carboxylesterase